MYIVKMGISQDQILELLNSFDEEDFLEFLVEKFRTLDANTVAAFLENVSQDSGELLELYSALKEEIKHQYGEIV